MKSIQQIGLQEPVRSTGVPQPSSIMLQKQWTHSSSAHGSIPVATVQRVLATLPLMQA